MIPSDEADDPRTREPATPPASLGDDGPIVGRQAAPLNAGLIVAAFALLAILLFVWLNAHRTQAAQASLVAPSPGAKGTLEPPPPLGLPLTPVSATGPFQGLPAQVSYVAPAPATVAAAPPLLPSASGAELSDTALAERRHAPAVVVDLGGPTDRLQVAQAVGAAPLAGGSSAGPLGGSSPAPRLNDSEQFAQRVGDESPEQARATPMHNLGRLVPQGAMIPGVLETAINSDLPGYTRAVVSRDVLSFDGKSVLIPRGSRLIGQYKSAVALGQSRAFIIWTRVIRPDGVSVQIGSPGTDALGRGGLDGDVDRHFFRRFSGSILLSVLNAGVAAIGSRPSTEISIGSPSAAAGIAGSITQGDPIPPTIKVAQGEAIRIFVARDLDFSGVEPVP